MKREMDFDDEQEGRAEALRACRPATQHSRWMDDDCEPELVSVIIPTYNRRRFLEAAMDSVWAQSYRPIELLVVDDGSTDGTAALVRQWREHCASEDDFDVHYFRQENSGAPVARNRGALEARGAYLQFMDSDDLLHPQKLEIQQAGLQAHPNCDFSWTAVSFFEDGHQPDSLQQDVEQAVQSMTASVIRKPGQASHPEAALFRRRAVKALGPWHEDLARWQDWEYCFRIALGRFKATRSGVLYYSRNHDRGHIGDLRFCPEGVTANLNTMHAIDQVLAATDVRDPALHRTARNLYVNTLRRALRNGTEEQVHQSLQGIARHNTRRRTELGVRLLKGLFHLLGRKVVLACLNIYSKLMAG